jgi:small subunit ribosomal protein S6e
MVEFKVVVNDTKKGKSHNIEVSGHHANSLIGKKIGDEVDGIFVSLPGYKLTITGGTDKNGFPMRPDFPGTTRRRVLLSSSIGYHPNENGKRKKKSIRGNSINQDVIQINMKVTKHSNKPIEDILKTTKQKEEKIDEKIEEKTEAT